MPTPTPTPLDALTSCTECAWTGRLARAINPVDDVSLCPTCGAPIVIPQPLAPQGPILLRDGSASQLLEELSREITLALLRGRDVALTRIPTDSDSVNYTLNIKSR